MPIFEIKMFFLSWTSLSVLKTKHHGGLPWGPGGCTLWSGFWVGLDGVTAGGLAFLSSPDPVVFWGASTYVAIKHCWLRVFVQSEERVEAISCGLA